MNLERFQSNWIVLKETRRVIPIFLVVILLSCFNTPDVNAKERGPGDVVGDLAERAIGVLRDKDGTTFAERESAFRSILVEGFHIPTISRFVLGRYWKTATDVQRDSYNKVFVDFLVRVYASRFDAYSGETIEIIKVVKSDIKNDMIVRTKILRPGGKAPVGVDYRARIIDGGYKVVDVNVEGISMLHTHRVEFASVINRLGMDGFLNELRAQLEVRGLD